MVEHEVPPIVWAEEPREWPEAPEWMSFYRLREAESCPRRAALKSARYAAIWSGPGYPQKLRLPALLGQVIHSCVRTLSIRLSRAGCLSIRDPRAVSLLRDLGGYSQVIRNCVDALFAEQSTNPRGIVGRQMLLDAVQGRVPEMREQVQIMLGRLQFGSACSVQASRDSQTGKRSALSKTSHFEVQLRAPSLGWIGVADYIDLSESRCEIVDFKTGNPVDDQESQLRIYALLWARDREGNPEARPADRLTLSYQSGEVQVGVPSEAELKELEEEIKKRTKSVRAALGTLPPEAKPNQHNCGFCEVRHLCRDYWVPETQRRLAEENPPDTSYGDVQIRIISQQAAKNWKGVVVCSQALASATPVALKTPRFDNTLDEAPLREGDQIRILDARITPSSEPGSSAMVTMSELSEGFLVGEHRTRRPITFQWGIHFTQVATTCCGFHLTESCVNINDYDRQTL